MKSTDPLGYEVDASLPRPSHETRNSEVLALSLLARQSHAARLGTQGHSIFPLRVLVADDYADAAESLALVLSIAGIETGIALDGEQALTCATEWRPHVCVLDIQMPKLDGCAIARRIREQSWIERPLLIALSGWTSAQDKRTALEAGFDHYMTKPANLVSLLHIMQSYLRRAGVSRSCM
jgi:DNA-binding response OmpR family regulator